MKTITTIFLLLLACRLHAGLTRDTLPPEAELYAALDARYAALLDAELAELRLSNKGSWLRYLPSIGITYTVTGEPRPMIAYSTNTLYLSLRDRQRREAKQHSLQQANRLARDRARQQLAGLLHRYRLLQQELALLENLQAIDAQLYELAFHAYETAQTPPSQFLPQKRAFLNKQLQLFRKRMELEGVAMEVWEMVR